MAGSSYQLEIDDTSPIVSYLPYPDSFSIPPDLLGGWVPSYSDVSLTNLGQEGIGDSAHITSRDGAVLSITWFGTGIQLYGNSTNATYAISVDGVPESEFSPSVDNNILAEIEDLSNANHTLTLTAHINSSSFEPTIVFDRAIVAVSTDFANATFTTASIDDASMLFRGGWAVVDEPVLPAQSQSFNVSQTIGDELYVPFNGTAITVSGFRDYASGYYNVSLDGLTTSYDGQSSFTEPTLLFVATGLNTDRLHILLITNAQNQTLGVGNINVTTVSAGTAISSVTPTPSSSSAAVGASGGTSRGTIAALVLAGVIAFLLLLSLIVWLMWRQHRRTKFLDRFKFKCSSRDKRQEDGETESDFIDIQADYLSKSNNAMKSVHDDALPRPPMSGIRFSFRPSVTLQRPREITLHSPTARQSGPYGDVIDISPRNDSPAYTRDSSVAALFVDVEEARDPSKFSSPHTLDLPVSITQSAEYPTPSQIAPSGEIPFAYVPRPNHTHPFSVSRDPSGGSITDSTGRSCSNNNEGSEASHSRQKRDTYLSVRDVSPFHVDFPDLESAGSKRQSEASAAVPSPDTADAPRITVQEPTPRSRASLRQQIYSFLDFSSTSSRLNGSSPSRSVHQSAVSGVSSSYTSEGARNNRASQSAGMQRLSLSVSEDNPGIATLTDPLPPSPSQRRVQGESQPSSPADSIPKSVSDIQFRHSIDAESDVSVSRRTSGSHRLPHPPLPQSSSATRKTFGTPPLIAQKLLGRSPPPGSPGYILQQRPQGPRPPSLTPGPSASRKFEKSR